MAMDAPVLADGTTLTFTGYVGFALARSIRHTGIDREIVAAPSLATVGAIPKLASGMYDSGQIAVELWFDSDLNATEFEATIKNKTAGTLAISFPGTVPTVMSNPAFLRGFEWGGGVAEVYEATATFELAPTSAGIDWT